MVQLLVDVPCINGQQPNAVQAALLDAYMSLSCQLQAVDERRAAAAAAVPSRRLGSRASSLSRASSAAAEQPWSEVVPPQAVGRRRSCCCEHYPGDMEPAAASAGLDATAGHAADQVDLVTGADMGDSCAQQSGSEEGLGSAHPAVCGSSARGSPVKPLVLPAPDASVSRPPDRVPGGRAATGSGHLPGARLQRGRFSSWCGLPRFPYISLKNSIRFFSPLLVSRVNVFWSRAFVASPISQINSYLTFISSCKVQGAR